MFRTALVILVVAVVIGSLMPGNPPAASTPQAAMDFDSVRPSHDAGTTPPSGAIELTRDFNGHFFADVEINNMPVRLLVDTGASEIALSRRDADRAGLAVSSGMFEVIGEGADGEVRGERVLLDRVRLGSTTAEPMPAVVLDSGDQSLLGQSFLSRFSSVEIHGDTMVLR